MGLDLSRDRRARDGGGGRRPSARPTASASKIKKGDAGDAIALVREPGPSRRGGRGARGHAPGARRLRGRDRRPRGAGGLRAKKLTEKRVDLVVANEASDSFGRDDDRATLVTHAGAEPLPTMTKGALADVVLGRVRALLGLQGK